MALEIVRRWKADGAGGGCFVGVVCHAGFYFLDDVDDDGFVPGGKIRVLMIH